MAPDVRVHTAPGVDLSEPLVVVGFPTIGLVGIIASQYVTRRLEMEHVGGLHSSLYPPVALVDGGLASPPIRMFSKTTSCTLELECHRLVVLTAEFTPGMRMMHETADAIAAWAKQRGAPMVLVPDGIVTEDESEVGSVWGAASSREGLAFLDRAKIEPLGDGIVGGFSGAMLTAAQLHGIHAVCLLAATRPEHPDARAAASIVKILDDVLPDIEIETAPLLKEAEEIEATVRAMREEVAQKGGGDETPMFR